MGCPTRRGIVDIWNAFMVSEEVMCEGDIPMCWGSLIGEPKELVSWTQAKSLVKYARNHGNKDFRCNALVHFYQDDQKFDSPNTGIWQYPKNALEVLRHFDGIVTPDYSTYQDFPDPIKRHNTYRMRAFGCWVRTQGLQVLNNVRWGDADTWSYCFAGIPEGAPVCVGSVASGLREKVNAPLYETGFKVMLDRLSPTKVYFYGSPGKAAMHLLAEREIPYRVFESDARRAHKVGEADE